MSEHHDHRDDCPFKFATLDVCDCVEKNMLDRIEQLVATNEALEAKLSKAEAGLLAIAKRDEQMIWGEDYEVEEAFKDMRDISCATLAEIKGGNDAESNL